MTSRRSALITGAGQGMDPGKGEQAAEEIRAGGGNALAATFDVTDLANVSEQAGWVTGQTLVVNGGSHAY